MNLQNWVGIEIGSIYEISLNILQSSSVTNKFLLKWRKFHIVSKRQVTWYLHQIEPLQFLASKVEIQKRHVVCALLVREAMKPASVSCSQASRGSERAKSFSPQSLAAPDLQRQHLGLAVKPP